MSALHCQPDSRYRRSPAYPTKLQILATPDLLEKYQPSAWMSRQEIAATVGVLLAAQAAGCQRQPLYDRVASTPAGIDQQTVAPIFRHGDGRGAAGCSVIAPPTFLSEDEARQVIEEELAKFDIRISARDVELEQVKIPRRYLHFIPQKDHDYREEIVEFPEDGENLSVDLLDNDRQIAIEYITNTDNGFLGGPIHQRGNYSSSRHYDLIDTALYLRDKLQGVPLGLHFGIFYDPLTNAKSFVRWTGNESRNPFGDWLKNRNSEERRNPAREESKRLLREQVRDFIDWLKAQGVI